MADYVRIEISCRYNNTFMIVNNRSGRNFGRSSHVRVPFADIKTISCGYSHFVAVSKSSRNKLYVWGCNRFGQLGLGYGLKSKSEPQELFLCSDIKSISCGSDFTIALLKSGEAYGWGRNLEGQLGFGDGIYQYTPRKFFPSGTKLKLVSCGGSHTIALTSDNNLYVCGYNSFGQLGLGDTYNKYTPTKLECVLSGEIRSISCGEYHSVLLTSDKIYVWGHNIEGQLGLGPTDAKLTPEELLLPDVMSISCGGFHTLALTSSGTLYVWGYNEEGQLGLGHFIHQSSPQKLYFSESIKSIHCGIGHSVIVTINDDIYVWGFNYDGQLGLGEDDTENKCLPQKFHLEN